MFLRLRSEEKAHILKFCAAFESAGLHSRNTVMDRMLTTKKLAAIVVLRRRVYCLHFEPSAHLRITYDKFKHNSITIFFPSVEGFITQ